MNTLTNKYLKHIDLIFLENWSVHALLDAQFNYSNEYELARIGDFLVKNRTVVNIEDDKEYSRVTVKINNNGVILRDREKGINIGTKKQYRVKIGQFIISKIDARNGAFGVIPAELNNAIVTNDFPLFDVNTEKINPQFLLLITTTKAFIKFAQSCSSGTTNRQRMDVNMFLNQKIPLPKLIDQDKIVNSYFEKINEAEDLSQQAINLESEIEKYIYKELGLINKIEKQTTKGIHSVDFVNLSRWDTSFLFQKDSENISKYPLVTFGSLFENLNNGIPARNYTESGTRFLKVADLKNNCIDDSNVKYIKKFRESDLVEKNTLLITRKGTVGNSYYVTEHNIFTASSEIFIIKLNKRVRGNYLAEINQIEFIQNQYREKNTGTIMPSLSQEKLKEILVPLPSIEKQKEIELKIQSMKIELNKFSEMANRTTNDAKQEFENAIFKM